MTKRTVVVLAAMVSLTVPACGKGKEPPSAVAADKKRAMFPDPTEKDKPQTGLLKNEVPADQLDQVVRAHYQGLGFMEQYEYGKAANAFREVHERAPGWIPGSINLAIALLNDTGTQAEQAKKAGGGRANFDLALGLLNEVLARDQGNLNAHYCRALILEFLGQTAEAHKDFVFVADHDPTDGHALLKVGATLTSPSNPSLPAGPEQAERLIDIYSKALDRNPYLVTALYKLQQAYGWARRGDRQAAILARWRKLNPKTNPAGPGDTAEAFYGESGKYARVVNPFPPARAPTTATPAARFEPPAPITVALPKGDRWVRPGDFTGPTSVLGRARTRFGATIATFDADGDGRSDLFLGAAVKGGKGVRDALLLNKGDGVFEDVSRAWGLPDGRASLGAAAGDFDADRRIDLFLTGPDGYRLLRNESGKGFEDVTSGAGMDQTRALGVTARWLDLDQDGDLDLYVVNYTDIEHSGDAFGAVKVQGVSNAAFRNVGKPAPVSGRPRDNWAPLAVAPADYPARAGLSIEFTPWPDADALDGPPANSTSIAALDLDDDRDLDLILGSEDLPPRGVLNDRLGVFHSVELTGLIESDAAGAVRTAPLEGRDAAAGQAADPDRAASSGGGLQARRQSPRDETPSNPIYGLLVADFDKDGRADVAAISGGGRLLARRNTTVAKADARSVTWEPWPVDLKGWRNALAADINLDTWPDLVGLPTLRRTPILEWAENDGSRLTRRELIPGQGPQGDPSGRRDDTETSPDVEQTGPTTQGGNDLSGFALADVTGDPLPDLIVTIDGLAPHVARNLGNGEHWLALDLGGRWKTSFDHMRTNPHATGTRVTLEGQGLLVNHDFTTPSANLGQSVGPVVLGLGKSPSVELVRIRWPDGTMQCELNQKADVLLKISETNRKTGSCPVLFTWNGRRFVCVGDFLGGGGLGYLVAPGVYGQPDRDESVAIAGDQLRPVNGVLRLSVTEPMDEVAYLDRLRLVAVDRPPGVSVTPDERFAPEGTRPTGEVIAWKTAIAPEKASDLNGLDVTDALRDHDRRTVDGFRRLDGWVGYAEEHGIVLDFGDRLSRFGPDDRLVLCLAGWVEYPYSQTNYAAATAGVVLRAPAVERRNSDGTWTAIEPHAGYPAGLPRMTTLDLTGKLVGPRCVLRLTTNMECYWDQAFVALRDPSAESSVRQTTLPAPRAALGHRGYSREVSPDGREPLLYDYDHVDPAPLALMGGRLTRHGDVGSLLANDDDHFCVVGPGDEVRLEFEAGGLPDLPAGWSRSYVLKAVGYCKDADPLTATSDRVDPLPWIGMPAFPFSTDLQRPDDPAYHEYLRSYQTRPAGIR